MRWRIGISTACLLILYGAAPILEAQTPIPAPLPGEDRSANGSMAGALEPDLSDPMGTPGTETVVVKDSDRDGIPDDKEDMNGNGELEPWGSDGVMPSRDDETDPLDADTDDDGLSDGDEWLKFHTVPILADTDFDGLPDGLELGVTAHVAISGTDYTYDGNNSYVGSRSETSVVRPLPHTPRFKYFHPDFPRLAKVVDGISYPIERPPFIPDSSPRSTTDPLSPKTNGKLYDGMADTNSNGRFDQGEPADPAFRIESGSSGLFSQLGMYVGQPEAIDGSGLASRIKVYVHPGDFEGSLVVGLDPADGGTVLPSRIDTRIPSDDPKGYAVEVSMNRDCEIILEKEEHDTKGNPGESSPGAAALTP